MKHYDVVWIGASQATGTVAPRLVQAGKRAAGLTSWILGDLKPLEDA